MTPDRAAPLAHLLGERPPAPAWFAAALADAPERRWHQVEGARIETLAWGRRGRPGLLLLHGNGAHADWWTFIAPLLAAGRRVAALSWSGMGGSDWRAAYSLDLYVHEVLEVAQACGLFDAAVAPVLLGHSFGAFPALHCAAQHGERLRACIAVDLPLLTPAQRAARPRRDGPPRDVPRTARTYPTLQQALARFRLQPTQACENLYLLDHIARASLKPMQAEDGSPAWGWRFDPHLFRGYRMSNPARDLASARCPVALMRGSRSGLVDAEAFAYAVASAAPGSPAIEIPEADHHVMLDQPLAFAAAVSALLAGWP